MQHENMTREELMRTLTRRDLALYLGGRDNQLVVTAQSGAARRLIKSPRFRHALTREQAFIALWLHDDDAALCSDPRGHERHYRLAIGDQGETYTACRVCGAQRLLAPASGRVVSMASYRRCRAGVAV